MQKFKKFIIIFGLEYSVLWSVIVYFIWDTGPFIFTVLDAIAGIIIIHIGYKLYRDLPIIKADEFLYPGLMFISLVYNSLWTLAIMLFFEIDLAGIGLPLDLISLYATTSLAYTVRRTIRQNYLLKS